MVQYFASQCILRVTTKKVVNFFASLNLSPVEKSCGRPWLLLMAQPPKHHQSNSASRSELFWCRWWTGLTIPKFRKQNDLSCNLMRVFSLWLKIFFLFLWLRNNVVCSEIRQLQLYWWREHKCEWRQQFCGTGSVCRQLVLYMETRYILYTLVHCDDNYFRLQNVSRLHRAQVNATVVFLFYDIHDSIGGFRDT